MAGRRGSQQGGRKAVVKPGKGRSKGASPDESRSGQSIVEGGENEQRGEPPEGYFTVAPGKQNGGKR